MSKCTECKAENTLYNPRPDTVAVLYPRAYLVTCSACRAESCEPTNYGAKPPESKNDDCNIPRD